MSKRTTYIDGWHKKNENLSFRVEGGKICEGVWQNDSGTEQKQVFPYVFDKNLGCYNNVYGIRAYYGVLKRLRWY